MLVRGIITFDHMFDLRSILPAGEDCGRSRESLKVLGIVSSALIARDRSLSIHSQHVGVPLQLSDNVVCRSDMQELFNGPKMNLVIAVIWRKSCSVPESSLLT